MRLLLLLLHVVGDSECVANQDRDGHVLLDRNVDTLYATILGIDEYRNNLVLTGVLLLLLLVGDKRRLQGCIK